jgi:hypothetical protein
LDAPAPSRTLQTSRIAQRGAEEDPPEAVLNPRPPEGTAQIKGTNLAHTRDFVETAFGAEGWATVAAELSRAARDALESVIAMGWYPAHLHVELLRAIEQSLGTGDGSVVRRTAVHAADFDVTRIHRIFFRFANPGLVLEKSGELWSRFYDSGHWAIERPTSTSASATLTRFAIVDALYCDYLLAYFLRMFAIVGAKEMRMQHSTCRARGDSACRFDGQWR